MSDAKPLSLEERLWAAVGYAWILSLFVLASRKKNEYIRFHANQGVLLFALSVILMLIPGIGWVLNIIVTLTAIVGIIKAIQGKRWPLPLGADLAEKFGAWIVKTLKI